MRSQEQRYWDLYATLRIFEALNSLGSHADNLKVQKLTFLHELKGQEQGLRSAHYKFFRYNLGPFSKILAQDVESLEGRGFITKTSRQLTKRGRFLLELLSEDISGSKEAELAIGLIDETARVHGKTKSPRLVDQVYAMKVPVFDLGGQMTRVRDVSMFLDILDPLHMNLLEIQPFSRETLELVEEELSVDQADLEPTSQSYQAAVDKAMAMMRRHS